VPIGLGDGLTAIGLVLVIEGLFLAAAPDRLRRALTLMMSQPPTLLRGLGLGAMAAGVVIVWLVRG
jgi:uncharacterized protein